MMTASIRSKAIATALLGLLLFTGCLGPSHATGRLYQHNQSYENRWARSGIFILFLPAYFVTSWADKLVFNSWQWWTGNNPIDPPGRDEPAEIGL